MLLIPKFTTKSETLLTVNTTLLKDDILLTAKIRVRTYVTDRRRIAIEKSQPFVENNGSIIEQNSFITPKKKKLVTSETNKFIFFDKFI